MFESTPCDASVWNARRSTTCARRRARSYGEIVDSAWQWVAAADGSFGTERWAAISGLVERAAEMWDQPDHGIWEIRAPDRLFTYSVAMCEMALDRGSRLARRLGLPGDVNPQAFSHVGLLSNALLMSRHLPGGSGSP